MALTTSCWRALSEFSVDGEEIVLQIRRDENTDDAAPKVDGRTEEFRVASWMLEEVI